MPTRDQLWPAIDYASEREALDALHMRTQVVGKVKLALTRTESEWQNVPLWVSARGLTTGLMRAGGQGLEIAFDLVDHRLIIGTTDGRAEEFDLVPCALRRFTAQVMAALTRLGTPVRINPMTVEVPNPVRCDDYEGYDAYDAEVAGRLHGAFARTALAFDEFRSEFWGKQTRPGLYWGTFDLSMVRYNLVPLPPRDGVGVIRRVAMDSEQSEVGFWPGNEGYPRPAFYAYTFPKPEGIEGARVGPPGAAWDEAHGEFLLDYDHVRGSGDPVAAILEFARSTYAAGADLSGWNRELLDRTPPT